MKAIVNKGCIGCRFCATVCPEVFKINEDTEKSEVIASATGFEDKAEEAAAGCPVAVIELVDD